MVWSRFGRVGNYIEPFFGSGAVLLARKPPFGIETINDADRFVANFWRAAQHAPDGVSLHADNPVNEADLHARHEEIMRLNREWFNEKMHTDPEFYDAKIAGWWVWGISSWIGSNWCEEKTRKSRPHLQHSKGVHSQSRKIPQLRNSGMGIHSQWRKRPHLGNSGLGVHSQSRQIPHLGGASRGINRQSVNEDYFRMLCERLRNVRVCCGDWTRVMGPAVYSANPPCGVFLDPPYSVENRDGVYSTDSFTVAHDVREWAIANGNNPNLRIALCGYESEHAMPESWECVQWKAHGGYGSNGNAQGRENKHRERVWFSPHCIKPMELF